jgi:hypothetical protein
MGGRFASATEAIEAARAAGIRMRSTATIWY